MSHSLSHSFDIRYSFDWDTLPSAARDLATDYLHKVAEAAGSLPSRMAQDSSSFWFDVGEFRCFYVLDLRARRLALQRVERRDHRGLSTEAGWVQAFG